MGILQQIFSFKWKKKILILKISHINCIVKLPVLSKSFLVGKERNIRFQNELIRRVIFCLNMVQCKHWLSVISSSSVWANKLGSSYTKLLHVHNKFTQKLFIEYTYLEKTLENNFLLKVKFPDQHSDQRLWSSIYSWVSSMVASGAA